ncbi:LOW QUALITY PROTEIN: hypothetical protein YC2023_106458 [Brassica napus]
MVSQEVFVVISASLRASGGPVSNIINAYTCILVSTCTILYPKKNSIVAELHRAIPQWIPTSHQPLHICKVDELRSTTWRKKHSHVDLWRMRRRTAIELRFIRVTDEN